MGELAGIALFNTDNACEMKVEKPACHKIEETTQIENSSCCEDQLVHVEAQNELLPIVKATLSLIQFIQVAIICAPELLNPVATENEFSYQYTPPLIVRDISILHDTFLI